MDISNLSAFTAGRTMISNDGQEEFLTDQTISFWKHSQQFQSIKYG